MTMTPKQAKSKLRQHGFNMSDFAQAQGVTIDSLSRRWSRNETISKQDELALTGFLHLQDTEYQRLKRYADNPAIVAMLQQLERLQAQKSPD